MSIHPSAGAQHPPAAHDALRVVVVGGGIAAAEPLLALRDLAGDLVSLTLVCPTDELVLPALTVAEPFALGHAQRYPLGDLLAHVSADHVPGALASIDPDDREILLQDGTTVAFDALILAVGAPPVAAVENASTWWPQDSPEAFGGLLRDLEEGYVKRVAFVIPPGPVWPLPLYELALMTSREVWSMGINDAQSTVITPEAVPLARFGSAAAVALREELKAAAVRLEAATTARVNRAQDLKIVLQPTVDELEVDRVIALPGLQGPRIPGSTQDKDGFIPVNHASRMRDSTDIWAAGDAIAYPIKFGGLATRQADMIAADIAARVGAGPTPTLPAYASECSRQAPRLAHWRPTHPRPLRGGRSGSPPTRSSATSLPTCTPPTPRSPPTRRPADPRSRGQRDSSRSRPCPVSEPESFEMFHRILLLSDLTSQ